MGLLEQTTRYSIHKTELKYSIRMLCSNHGTQTFNSLCMFKVASSLVEPNEKEQNPLLKQIVKNIVITSFVLDHVRVDRFGKMVEPHSFVQTTIQTKIPEKKTENSKAAMCVAGAQTESAKHDKRGQLEVSCQQFSFAASSSELLHRSPGKERHLP